MGTLILGLIGFIIILLCLCCVEIILFYMVALICNAIGIVTQKDNWATQWFGKKKKTK